VSFEFRALENLRRGGGGDAAAIRTVFEQEGELSAAIEVRRRFPGITDNAKAREHARIIAGWQPLPPLPPKAALARHASKC
jgi:hypothetical protein